MNSNTKQGITALPTHCNCRCGHNKELTPDEQRYFRDSDPENDTILCFECERELEAHNGLDK